jgi:hypothetical protein
VKNILAVILVSLILLLPGCGGTHYYPPSGNPPPETFPPSPSTSPTAPAHEAPSPVSNPSLNVRIDYIGIKNAHDHEDYLDPFHGEVQLVIVVTDGQTLTEEGKILIPPTKQGFEMGDFETKEINRRIFHTSSVGDYLRVLIVAYDVDSNTEALTALSILEALGVAEASELKTIVSLLPEEDDFVGYYEEIWYPDEDWGIGQYNEVGHDDFRVWLSVWAAKEPSPVSKPYLLPDVKIQKVDMPSQVKQSNSGWFYWKYYTNTLTLVNKEPIPVEVNWNALTSAEKEFGGTVTVPAKGQYAISRHYFYENDVGPLDWTYTISHNGRELDSWHGTMNVIPGPYS